MPSAMSGQRGGWVSVSSFTVVPQWARDVEELSGRGNNNMGSQLVATRTKGSAIGVGGLHWGGRVP